MEIKNWRYYNRALLPTIAPHEDVDISAIKDKSIWKHDKKPLLARWTSDFDCGFETNWWYIIKDKPFDISELKAKRRYEINKALKYFEVKKIDPSEFKDDIYNVLVEAYSAYPAKYRPSVNKESLYCGLSNSMNTNGRVTYGAFFKESGQLCGYAYIVVKGKYISFPMQKTIPEFEKYNVNAALVNGILHDCEELLKNGSYICDGERSISHETRFQDYLEKYFSFRKAYCKLHIEYNPRINWLLKLLFPFRKIMKKFDFVGFVHHINSVLKMEELKRR